MITETLSSVTRETMTINSASRNRAGIINSQQTSSTGPKASPAFVDPATGATWELLTTGGKRSQVLLVLQTSPVEAVVTAASAAVASPEILVEFDQIRSY